MRTSFIYIILILICFNTIAATTFTPSAIHGHLDLSDWNFKDEGIIKLHGNWEFYWDTLINPSMAIDSAVLKDRKYIKVPASWASKKAGSYPTTGVATYRLHLFTDSLEGDFALRIYDIFTASKVWYDNRLIYESGKISPTEKGYKPGFDFKTIPIYLSGNSAKHELIIEVANFKHKRAGLARPMFFGTYDQLTHQHKGYMVLNILIVGVLLVISFFHFLYFFLQKSDRSNLYFGILCVVMILRNVSTYDRLITYVFPNINWELLFKLDNFSGFGTIPLFALFLYLMYKEEFPRLALRIFMSIGAIITLLVLLSPQLFYGKFRMLFELYILFGGLYLTFYVLLKATLKKRVGALLSFIGFFLLYSTAINDVLNSMGLIQTANVAPYGLVSYMLIQSYILSRRSGEAIVDNVKLGKALNEEKLRLENRVVERTSELEEQNQEMQKQREKLELQGWFNEKLSVINNVLNSQNEGVQNLCRHFISSLIDNLEMNVGAIYLRTHDKSRNELGLIASWGASREMLEADPIPAGVGMVGSCYQDGNTMHINNLAEGYLKLESGLGNLKIRNMILLPLISNEVPIGVMELASIEEITPRKIELLERVSESIASAVLYQNLNEKNSKLEKDYSAKESELNQRDEEMRNVMEELTALREKESINKA